MTTLIFRYSHWIGVNLSTCHNFTVFYFISERIEVDIVYIYTLARLLGLWFCHCLLHVFRNIPACHRPSNYLQGLSCLYASNHGDTTAGWCLRCVPITSQRELQNQPHNITAATAWSDTLNRPSLRPASAVGLQSLNETRRRRRRAKNNRRHHDGTSSQTISPAYSTDFSESASFTTTIITTTTTTGAAAAEFLSASQPSIDWDYLSMFSHDGVTNDV